jgi:glycosyltransferase involved in cell wall biosynthesis
MPALMRAADLFVLPSQWEGLPNVVLEAMAAGTPVVATAVEGVADLLASGTLGTIVPQNGEPGLAAAIAKALDERDKLLATARSAQLIVAERFTWSSVAAEYDLLYSKILSRGTKPA